MHRIRTLVCYSVNYKLNAPVSATHGRHPLGFSKMPSFPRQYSTTTTAIHSKIKTRFILLTTSLLIIYILFTHSHTPTSPPPLTTTPTTLHHLLFGIASSSASYPSRHPYLRIWWKPHLTRGYVFLDRNSPNSSSSSSDPTLPPTLVSHDTSRFPYTFPRGLRSAVRVARIVKEIVDLDLDDVRWFVFGDDDTVFFTDNLARTLSKYDHSKWFYVGSNSENFDQNSLYSFDMAFGGGGFAISYPLARVLARVLDSCLMRYSHLYGSDSRIFSCLAELGVGLTHEPGFHQIDIRGDLFGLLSAHPLAPLVSLHHLGSINPIFPGMNHTQALEQFFQAVEVDPGRILQQSVCYDPSKSLTISISWGYSVQVYEGNQLLPDLLRLQRTFVPWRKAVNNKVNPFMFNLRDFPKDPCDRPAVFFFENIFVDKSEVQSNYRRHFVKNCLQNGLVKNLDEIRVFTQKLDLDVGQLEAPRRQCCDVLSSFDTKVEIGVRQCGDEELISMNP